MANKNHPRRSTIGRLYDSYGGISGVLESKYAWFAAAFAAASWRLSLDGKWVAIAQSILPTLAGFSIAAYALFFAVLSEKERGILRNPVDGLNGRSPLLVMASTVSHSAMVQITGLIFSLVFSAKPLPTIEGFEQAAEITNMICSFSGMFLLYYGVNLIVANILTIFTIIELKPATKRKPVDREQSTTDAG